MVVIHIFMVIVLSVYAYRIVKGYSVFSTDDSVGDKIIFVLVLATLVARHLADIQKLYPNILG